MDTQTIGDNTQTILSRKVHCVHLGDDKLLSGDCLASLVSSGKDSRISESLRFGEGKS